MQKVILGGEAFSSSFAPIWWNLLFLKQSRVRKNKENLFWLVDFTSTNACKQIIEVSLTDGSKWRETIGGKYDNEDESDSQKKF